MYVFWWMFLTTLLGAVFVATGDETDFVLCLISAHFTAKRVVCASLPPKSAEYHNTPDNPFTHGQRIGPITPRDTP